LINYHKYLLIIIITFIAFSGFSQNSENPEVDSVLINKLKHSKPVSYILKTNFLPMLYSRLPLTSEYRLLGEFALSSKQSICIGGSYLGKTILLNIVYPPRTVGPGVYIQGYRFQAAYKYYLVQKIFTPMGLYLSPHFSYYSANYSYEPMTSYTDYEKLTNFTAQFHFGAQILIKNKAAFDFFHGIGYNKYTYTQYDFDNKTKRTISKDPGEFGGIFNLSPVSYVLLGFNFGLAF
jgi:hypothetical protein